MKALIIEDEAAACSNLCKILKTVDPSIEIITTLDTVTGSVLWLRSNPAPDLIFMDIQLADGTAFNIIECVNIESPVIFTTAFDEYALQAFRLNSIDYLLKPITLESVRGALLKLDRIRQFSFRQYLDKLDGTMQRHEYRKRILVPVRDKIISVSTDELAFCYNTDGSTALVTLDESSYHIDKSLDTLIAPLDPAQFIRANRQFIIAKQAIRDLTVWFDSRLRVNLVVPTPEPVFVSKNKALEFKNWYGC